MNIFLVRRKYTVRKPIIANVMITSRSYSVTVIKDRDSVLFKSFQILKTHRNKGQQKPLKLNVLGPTAIFPIYV